MLIKGRDQQNELLTRVISRFLPDVFYHPVWIHFVGNLPNYSPEILQNLLQNLLKERTQGDLLSNCQVDFMCAFLQSRLGEHLAALTSIEQVLKLAETHSIQRIERFASWGASAICARHGKYQQAVDWLSWLQKRLQAKDEWVLANILELFQQTLENQALNPGSDAELLNWLLLWGEWPLDAEAKYQSTGSYGGRPGIFPLAGFLSRFDHKWKSFWDSFMSVIGRKRLLLESPQTTAISSLPVPPPQFQASPSPQTPPSFLNQTEPPSLAVYCLGQFRVYQDEKLIVTWPSGKGKAVFKYMVANFGRPVSKDVLMDTFWREYSPESARNNLSVAIYGLRQAFRALRPDYSSIIFQDDHYLLNQAISMWVDFEEFTKLYRAGQELDRKGMVLEAVREYELAESLYQGDFLEEDLYEDWPFARRESLKASYQAILDRLSHHYFEGKRYATCIHLCKKILVQDDCHEEAHRRLMRCYFYQGQPHLALRQYHLCVEMLKKELDILPTTDTKDLYEMIRIHNRG